MILKNWIHIISGYSWYTIFRQNMSKIYWKKRDCGARDFLRASLVLLAVNMGKRIFPAKIDTQSGWPTNPGNPGTKIAPEKNPGKPGSCNWPLEKFWSHPKDYSKKNFKSIIWMSKLMYLNLLTVENLSTIINV